MSAAIDRRANDARALVAWIYTHPASTMVEITGAKAVHGVSSYAAFRRLDPVIQSLMRKVPVYRKAGLALVMRRVRAADTGRVCPVWMVTADPNAAEDYVDFLLAHLFTRSTSGSNKKALDVMLEGSERQRDKSWMVQEMHMQIAEKKLALALNPADGAEWSPQLEPSEANRLRSSWGAGPLS